MNTVIPSFVGFAKAPWNKGRLDAGPFRCRRHNRVRGGTYPELALITGAGRKVALNPAFKWGQHHPRQHPERHHWYLPRHPRQACTPLPRRIRVPLQPPIRSRLAVRTPPMPYRLLKLAEDHA